MEPSHIDNKDTCSMSVFIFALYVSNRFLNEFIVVGKKIVSRLSSVIINDGIILPIQ